MSVASLMSLPIVLLLVGTFLLVRGLRGRIVGDHPFCRRCGFDLFGLPEGIHVCSECGANLEGRRAIRIGTRDRRRGMLVAAAIFLLPALLVVGALGWGKFRNIKWIEHEPYWMILRQSHSSVSSERDEALTELAQRVTAGGLSDARIDVLVDEMLAAQADLNRPWTTARGDIVDAAHAAGKVELEKWLQYVLNAPQLSLRTRQDVRRGDPLPVRVYENAARVGSRARLGYDASLEVLPSDLVAAPQPKGGSMGGSVSSRGAGSFGQHVMLDPKLLAEAPEGSKTLRVRVKMKLFDSTGSTERPPTATKDVDLKTTWNLVSADAQTVKIIDNASYRDAVEKGIKVNGISRSADSKYVSLNLSLGAVPVAVSYRIILRAHGREWPLRGISAPPNSNTGWGTGAPVNDFDADVVDVIFRPDLKTALETVDIKEYWNAEVTVKDVSVSKNQPRNPRAQGAATRKAS